MTDTTHPVPDPFRLDGRAVLVTGGTAGIGEAIARDLGAAGASVVVASRRAESVAATAAAPSAAGVAAHGVAMDVTSEASVARGVAQAVERFDGLDVLVNCAGGSYGEEFRRGPLADLGGTDLLEAYRLNTISAFLCSTAALPALRARRGAVVNVASVAAFQVERGMGAYGAAKAGMVQLGTALAHEWAPDVRVNTVAPGHIDTPRVSARRSPERVRRLVSEIALARLGTPEDVAHAVRYLASPAGAWTTGSVLHLDGGQRAG